METSFRNLTLAQISHSVGGWEFRRANCSHARSGEGLEGRSRHLTLAEILRSVKKLESLYTNISYANSSYARGSERLEGRPRYLALANMSGYLRF